MVAAPLGVAVTERVVVLEMLDPLVGLVKVTVGAGTELLTVTAMVALPELPRLSVATAVSVWLALVNVVVLSWMEYGAPLTLPKLKPSTLNRTLAMVAAPLGVAVTERAVALRLVDPLVGVWK